MFPEQENPCKMREETYDALKREMETRLSVAQQEVIRAGIPVVILFEGFRASGRGAAISSLILNFDPRGFAVYSTRKPDAREQRRPRIARFAEKIPARGRIAVFDRAWYSGIAGRDRKKKRARRTVDLEEINTFERQLADDGYLILKFFLFLSEKEQRKRMKALRADPNTAWRVTKSDWKRQRHYGRNLRCCQRMLEMTDKPYARWNVIDARDKRHTCAAVMRTVAEALEKALAARTPGTDAPAPADGAPDAGAKFHLLPIRKIQEYDLSKSLAKEEYGERLHCLQEELRGLHNLVYRYKIPVVIGYEGNDAAGKGGSIKRLARALDPRGYTVYPIAAPTPEELSHHYLWRFYNRLPRTGHIAIFDRTWYGRVLVERVEGLTPGARVMQAYREIDEFEWTLHKWGAVLVKFWLTIDRDEQLLRFRERENTPEKQWKITPEDWRNREKWDLYEDAVNDMLQSTNTDFAPWTVVESNSKYYARVKTLETIVRAIKKRIGE